MMLKAVASARSYAHPEDGLREQSRETLAAIRGGLAPTPSAVAERFGLTKEAASKRLTVLRERGLIDGSSNHAAPIVDPVAVARAYVERADGEVAALRARMQEIESTAADYREWLAWWDERHPPVEDEEVAA
jgi:DNA-binding Lrp family transcriptional regulator